MYGNALDEQIHNNPYYRNERNIRNESSINFFDTQNNQHNFRIEPSRGTYLREPFFEPKH